MDLIAIAGALARIFVKAAVLYGAAVKGYEEKDLSLIEKLFEAGDVLSDARKGASNVPPRIQAVHTALITQAFGEACDEHWAGNKDLAPGLVQPSRLRRLFTSKQRLERHADIQSRLMRALDRWTASTSQEPKAQFDPRNALSADPVATPFYAALWEAFCHSLLESDDQGPLIDLGSGEEVRLEFEASVRTAYDEALTSPLGEPLAKHLLNAGSERPHVLRRLLAQRMATWGERHVFGDIETPGIPYIPLAEIYVEPDGVCEKFTEKERRAPIRTLIQELSEQHPIVIVRGDFGHGKSLTARMLAWEWARQYRNNEGVPSPRRRFPLFVKCGVDFLSHRPAMADTLRNALCNQARALGIELLLDDSAFQKPGADMDVTYLIDGLDEVVLTPHELEKFFDELRGHTSDRHRAVIFSRWGALPGEDKLKGIPVVDLAGLSTRDEDGAPGGQVSQWLSRWNGLSKKPPITSEQLRQAGLMAIASTPIVLLMIALTWDPERLAQGGVSRADIYERFFLQIARGKCEQDPDEHGPVKEASRRLREKLVDKNILPKGSLSDDKCLPEAMLWLMSRVAWEWRRFEQRGEHLTTHEVTGILKTEVGIKEDPRTEELIRVGMLLVMQANLQGGSDRILFGHKSFREFLVARYWASQLRRIVEARRDKEKEELGRALLGARLLEEYDKSFYFLLSMLNKWDDRQRETLVDWAEDRFNDETPHFRNESEPQWVEDQNPFVREAALAIGSCVQGSRGIRARHPDTLRSLLAWFWLTGRLYRIQAPGLIAPRANLIGASLFRANLKGANLSEANLEGANLFEAKLEGANLEGAKLYGANLAGANLDGAKLYGADLYGANLEGAKLVAANLKDACYSAHRTHWPEGFDPIAAGAINADLE